MAGTAKRYDTTVIRAGQVGDLWTGVAVPTAGNRITIDASTGTPDSTANPNAKHLGHTDAGTKVTINFTVTDHFVDEVPYPVKTTYDQSSFEFSGNLVQIFDEEMLKAVSENFATYGTGAGYKQFTIGTPPSVAYRTITFISPTPMDPTKFLVVQSYNACNTAGIDITYDRKGRAMTPFTFKSYALTSRAAADQLGNYWWQI